MRNVVVCLLILTSVDLAVLPLLGFVFISIAFLAITLAVLGK